MINNININNNNSKTKSSSNNHSPNDYHYYEILPPLCHPIHPQSLRSSANSRPQWSIHCIYIYNVTYCNILHHTTI